jgi:predicted metal-dependent hydrolase
MKPFQWGYTLVFMDMPAGSERGVTVEVRRSARRRRTVSAYRDGNTVIVLVPGRFTAAEEREWVSTMLRRLDARGQRKSSRHRSDAALLSRAGELSVRYFDGALQPASVRWAGNQRSRWGSCTPADAAIRLSTRLQTMPGWVIDYVLVHELAHLKELGHTDRFWQLVDRFPSAQRARGYLEGVAAAAGLKLHDDDVDSEA